MSAEKTLAELSDESGVPARTIRFYIARGLLDAPVKAGRGAAYTDDHLQRLERIKSLQSEGKMLSEIAALLSNGAPGAVEEPPATAWFQHEVAPDVYVMARAGMSPWRTKQVRAAIQQLAALLKHGSEE